MIDPRKGRLCILLAGVCLLLAGCLELVRRPTERGGATRSRWADSGNPSSGEDVKRDTVASSTTSEKKPAAPMSAAVAPKRESAAPGDRARISSRSSANRDDDHRKNVRQVNEYAFWCIRNSMWEEARLHLERALDQDSLAASLHNNLGVVYEKLGERDKAEEAYERARSLVPVKELYGANLLRLQDRKRLSLERPSDERVDSLSTGLELEEMTDADSLGLDPIGISPQGIR